MVSKDKQRRMIT